jgi:hypothetical protein
MIKMIWKTASEICKKPTQVNAVVYVSNIWWISRHKVPIGPTQLRLPRSASFHFWISVLFQKFQMRRRGKKKNLKSHSFNALHINFFKLVMSCRKWLEGYNCDCIPLSRIISIHLLALHLKFFDHFLRPKTKNKLIAWNKNLAGNKIQFSRWLKNYVVY